jgi:hypothetical protein
MATDYVGDLLRNAGLVTSADQAHAQQVAAKTGLPVGRALAMLGLVTPQMVQAATDAQDLIREHFITPETALQVLCVVSAQRCDFDDALRQVGVLDDNNSATSELGELLLHAEVVSLDQLADATNTSQHLGLPLGRILVLKGWLCEDEVESVLEAQSLMRDGRINRTQALEALRTMRLCDVGIRESLRRLGCEKVAFENKMRLGEILVTAGLVSQTDLLTALEISLVEGQPVGRALIEFGFLDEQVLEAALRLQALVNNCRLTPMQTTAALDLVARHGQTLVQAVSQVVEPELRADEMGSLMQLLCLAGLLTSEDCQRLLMFIGTSIFTVVLLESSLINETTLEVAIRCHLLVQEKLLTTDQAVVALHHWRWSGVSLSDILLNLGWNGEDTATPLELPLDETFALTPKKQDEYAPAPDVKPALVNKEKSEPTLVAASSERVLPVREQTMKIKRVDKQEDLHHTWGAPEVHHTWGVSELHHSWH